MTPYGQIHAYEVTLSFLLFFPNTNLDNFLFYSLFL